MGRSDLQPRSHARARFPERAHLSPHVGWGAVPFQRLYQPAPHALYSLALIPEWYLAIPILAALSVLGLLWRPLLIALPLLVFTIGQLGFELGWMDPADAARYSLPAMILFALAAACGFDVVRRSVRIDAVPWIATVLFAAISFWYVLPILAARTRGPSPANRLARLLRSAG